MKGMEMMGEEHQVPQETEVGQFGQKIDTAVDSGEKAIAENKIDSLLSYLGDLNAPVVWNEFHQTMEGRISGLSDEAKQGIETIVSILQSLNSLQDKDALLTRSSRKLVEVAHGLQALKQQPESSGIVSKVEAAASALYEVLAIRASKEDLDESLIVQGAMSAEDIARRREELSKHNIS